MKVKAVILSPAGAKDLLLKRKADSSARAGSVLRMTVFLVLFVNPLSASAEDLVDPALVQAQNKFALKVFRKLNEQNPDADKIFAPLEPGILLRIFYNAAGGRTRQEMAGILGLEGLDPDEIFNRNAGLWMLSQNTEKEEVEYWTPMSFLGSQETSFLEDFSRKAAFYKIIPKSYDLKHPGMPAMINEWIRDNTNRKIFNVTQHFDPESPAAVFSAFYFKGRWAMPFHKGRPPFMSTARNLEFYSDENFQAVNLPFGTGRFSLYAFLPTEKSGLKEFISALNESSLKSRLEGFLERPGQVSLPQIKLESNWDLREILKSLGMKQAFSPEAEFGQAIANVSGPAFLGSFEQQAVLETGKKSISSPLPVLKDADPSANLENFSLIFDRPFFFLLCDNKTAVWLALGVVFPKRP